MVRIYIVISDIIGINGIDNSKNPLEKNDI